VYNHSFPALLLLIIIFNTLRVKTERIKTAEMARGSECHWWS